MYYIILDSKWTVTECLKERKRDAEFEMHLFFKYELRSKRKVQSQEVPDQRSTLLLIILAF